MPVTSEFDLPQQFKTWGEARQAVVSARADGLVPSDVHKDTWKVFDTMAFLIIPRVNR